MGLNGVLKGLLLSSVSLLISILCVEGSAFLGFIKGF